MITPDLDKIKSTLVKVRRLAEDGTDGEKLAAKSKLSELLEKYGVDLSELDDEARTERDLKHHKDPDSRDIMIQVIVSIHDTKMWVTKAQCLVHANLTTQEYIEAIEKYRYYWELYQKQKKLFKSAFITKNGLYATTGDNTYAECMTEEDRKEIAYMQSALKEGNFSKDKPAQIEHTSED